MCPPASKAQARPPAYWQDCPLGEPAGSPEFSQRRLGYISCSSSSALTFGRAAACPRRRFSETPESQPAQGPPHASPKGP
eukprot:1147357-Alexandrium_andersonii.AAC.1